MNTRAAIYAATFKTGAGCDPYLLQTSPEITMALASKLNWSSPFAVTLTAAVALLFANAALASQGPGGGPGTASPFTQLIMAMVVYGASAIVVGAGLIGAARRH
jgi:hypothetical protein